MPDASTGVREQTEETTASVRGWLVIYLKGVFMGAADTVPGVSGGSIALITGIYERLVNAIAAIDIALVRDFIGFGTAPNRFRLRELVREVDLLFLMILGGGIATAVLTVSRAVAFGLTAFRAPMNAFFFGLIAASAVVLYREMELDTLRRWFSAALAVVFAFFLTGATAEGAVPHDLLIILIAGTVTSSAMLLPGISGAALLYVLGQYEFMIDALHGFVGALTRGDLATIADDGTVVGTFLLGVAFGLVSVAHVVRWALSRDRGTTLTILVSLMVGALRLPAEEVLTHTAEWSLMSVVGVLGPALLGIGLVLLLDRYTDDLDYPSQDPQ